MTDTVAIVGLGYVGLNLAVAFGRLTRTVGFDVDEGRLRSFGAGIDSHAEVAPEKFKAARLLEFTSDPKSLANADFIIVAVPTPIDEANQPVLGILIEACRVIGPQLRPGTTVVFESTVYPGCTEELCVPLLAEASGLTWSGSADGDPVGDLGFYVGYSPERINPGDQVHRLETITKVVAGDTPETLGRLTALYEMVIEAGVYRASSIKVAEAAKVIENTQRDLNIALMNELALIFHRLDIDTMDVLEAAGTKWNFLPFRPGLVGGHCIGVDPYYLTYKAEATGHHPQVILAGRKTNDSMGKYIAEQTIKQLAVRGHGVSGAPVTVLGLTFKEDCADIRNSRVNDLVRELEEYRCDVTVHDPVAEPEEAFAEYGIRLTAWDELPTANAIILAVPHRFYREMPLAKIKEKVQSMGCVIDVKCILDREALLAEDMQVWRL